MTGNSGRADRWTGRLSEYVDGDLSKRKQRALEHHLKACADCAAIVQELRGVVAEAPRLKIDSEPLRDLWPGVARRLAPRTKPARPPWLTFPGTLIPRLAAAAAVAALIVAALLLRPPSPSAPPAQVASSRTALGHTEPEREYETRVASLEREARARLVLDPRVVDVLEENLATLDMAIANYREALSADPGDDRLRLRLAETRERKLSVLQQAVTLAPEGTN